MKIGFAKKRNFAYLRKKKFYFTLFLYSILFSSISSSTREADNLIV